MHCINILALCARVYSEYRGPQYPRSQDRDITANENNPNIPTPNDPSFIKLQPGCIYTGFDHDNFGGSYIFAPGGDNNDLTESNPAETSMSFSTSHPSLKPAKDYNNKIESNRCVCGKYGYKNKLVQKQHDIVTIFFVKKFSRQNVIKVIDRIILLLWLGLIRNIPLFSFAVMSRVGSPPDETLRTCFQMACAMACEESVRFLSF